MVGQVVALSATALVGSGYCTVQGMLPGSRPSDLMLVPCCDPLFLPGGSAHGCLPTT